MHTKLMETQIEDDDNFYSFKPTMKFVWENITKRFKEEEQKVAQTREDGMKLIEDSIGLMTSVMEEDEK